MTLTLSYQHHSQMCVMMTERTSEEDKGSLVVIFTDRRITMSSKVMQMFSPLFRGLVADTSGVGGSDKKDPMTVILPDYNSEMMIHLMNIIIYGELVVSEEEKDEVKTEITHFAETLGIRMNLNNNFSPHVDISHVSYKDKIKLEDRLETATKPDLGTYQEDKSMIRIKREYFEESFKEEMKEEASLGHDADFNDNVMIEEALNEDESDKDESKDDVERDDIDTSDDEPQSCSTFKPKRSYRSMIEKYTFNSVTKNYSCRICHKEFSKPFNVGRHIKGAHEGLRLPCEICGKNYSDRSGLRLYIKAAHEGQRHPCKICGKNYSDRSGLRRHNISAHMDVNDP